MQRWGDGRCDPGFKMQTASKHSPNKRAECASTRVAVPWMISSTGAILHVGTPHKGHRRRAKIYRGRQVPTLCDLHDQHQHQHRGAVGWLEHLSWVEGASCSCCLQHTYKMCQASCRTEAKLCAQRVPPCDGLMNLVCDCWVLARLFLKWA